MGTQRLSSQQRPLDSLLTSGQAQLKLWQALHGVAAVGRHNFPASELLIRVSRIRNQLLLVLDDRERRESVTRTKLARPAA